MVLLDQLLDKVEGSKKVILIISALTKLKIKLSLLSPGAQLLKPSL